MDATPIFSLSFITVHPSHRSELIETPGNFHEPGTIGLPPRTSVLLEDLKTFLYSAFNPRDV